MVLQSIRDRLTGIIAIFILALIAIPFAFVGVSSYFTSDAVNAVAVVNDQEITVNEFNQGFQNYRRRMQSQLGAAFDPEQFDQAIVRRQFLDRMIDEELLAQVSIDAGLTVSNESLAAAIRNLPAFEVDGEFNVDVYQASLGAQGMSPQQFEAEIRSSMVLNQFPAAIAGSAIATEWELNDYARLQDQERTFSAILVPAFPAAESDAAAAGEEAPEAAADDAAAEAVVAEEPVEEEVILAWYQAHADDYLAAEQVVIEYIELDAAQLSGFVEPDEEVLRARFEEQKARFVTPESRLASHILIEVPADAPEVDIETARQLAEDLAVRAREGEDFAELAQEFSQDIGSASEGGDLGWIEPGYMVQAFEDAVYELSMEHPISEPVRTGFGWHVIYLRDIRPAEGMSFTEARDILEAEYRAEDEDRRYLEQADRLIDIIYEDPTTLSAAAEELGLEVHEAGPFGRLGGEGGIASNPDVVKAAFSDLVLAQGAVSDPIDLHENHMVLIRLKEHLPETLMPLEEVRDRVVESVRRQRAMDAAAATAQELLAAMQQGEDIQALAEARALQLTQAEGVTRTSTELDASLRDQLFLMEAPAEEGMVTQVVELPDGYAVVQLEDVRDGALSDEDVLRKQTYQRRIANGSASTEAMGFLRMLRAQSTIEIYEDRL
jgi:peptidyl-prolyl cis-trans isomerase D